MKLLLISNSTMPGKPFLDYPKYEIQKILGDNPVNAVFIPYAAVTFSFDEYCSKVEERFSEIGHHIRGIHTFDDPVKAIEDAEAIVVGGGNTWRLVRMLHENKLMNPIRERVFNGAPYIGWSAGANIACPTLRTTNDMPITDPLSFDTIRLVPFQINPHYTDVVAPGHAGETRDQRIAEFTALNPSVNVVGLREGSMLKFEEKQLNLIGEFTCKLFKNGQVPVEYASGDDLSFLMGEEWLL